MSAAPTIAPMVLTASVAGAWLASLLATAGLLRYARWRHLLDGPGHRRSHCVPTPRGGGAAIGLVVLAWEAWRAVAQPGEVRGGAALLLAIALVGGVGWCEDHRELPRWLRLAAHLVAGTLLAAGLAALPTDAHGLAVGVLVAVAVAWSINLHNFMDGIDGLAVMQALFVLLALAGFCAAALPASAGHLLVWAAAVAGFVPFNLPHARIFLGDAGSGVLGLLIAAAVLWQWREAPLASSTGVVLASAFIVDAGCTLSARVLAGRRWYSAHREHLYQWLVRRGYPHARVVGMYAIWNLLVVLSVAGWMNRSPAARAGSGIAPALALFGASVAVWTAGKRWCLADARRQRGRARAAA